MIGARGFEVPSEQFDMSFRRPPLTDWDGRALVFGMADPVSGPFVMLLYDAPSTPEQLAGPPDLSPPHFHPSDNMRVVLKGELIVGKDRYFHGDFRLQRTGRPYGRDGDAPHVEGNWRVIVFADRRGHIMRPTGRKLQEEFTGPAAMSRIRASFGDLLPEIIASDDNGVEGLVTNIDKPMKPLGNIDSCYDEAATWAALGNGSSYAISLMGDHEFGPVLIMQRTPAGAVATPGLTFDTDTFRCVISGSHERSGEPVQMGDSRFQAAGLPWEQVVAGPDGLDELIVVGDRRGAAARMHGVDEASWVATIENTIGTLKEQLQHSTETANSAS